MQLVEVKLGKWWRLLEVLRAVQWLSKLCDVWGALRNVGVSLVISFWGRVPSVSGTLKLEIILWDLEHSGHFCRHSEHFLALSNPWVDIFKNMFRRNWGNWGHKDWGSQVLEPYYVIDLCICFVVCGNWKCCGWGKALPGPVTNWPVDSKRGRNQSNLIPDDL
jgi:hypothetical protein